MGAMSQSTSVPTCFPPTANTRSLDEIRYHEPSESLAGSAVTTEEQQLMSSSAVAFDSCSGWIAAAIISTLTACAAFIVDVAEATVSDWKLGYCIRNPLLSKENCCNNETRLLGVRLATDACADFRTWSTGYWTSFAIHAGWALAFGIISCGATMLTRRSLPAVTEDRTDSYDSKPTAA
ncbi:uncharacterized protein IWZ02DRAFT_478400 [Phyllosticta citriasiana]|uniref:uncharacterized protein n=1 Tax=Phyllosticta citriasiana TaxID=595635 RepID=UPI0030FD7945